MSEHYILKGREAVPVDMMTWAEWFQVNRKERIVKRETVAPGVDVSTVFLGLNHAFVVGPPLIFETMVFGGEHDQDCERCSTYDEAERQHAAMVARVGSTSGHATETPPTPIDATMPTDDKPRGTEPK